MTNILFISRQRVIGRTNGSSVYLLDLAQAVRDAGMTPHLVQPAPSIMGRWPVLRLRPEMSVFATHRIRGTLKFGKFVVSLNPKVYLAIVRALIASIARRMGMTSGWTSDKPWPYAIAIPWTMVDHAFVRRHGSQADVAIADYMFQSDGFEDLPPATPRAIIMHDLFHAREGNGQDSVIAVSRKEELRRLSQADVIIAIQGAEARWVAEFLPESTVILAPVAAHPVPSPQPGKSDRLLFVGSNTAPNIVGLRWFLDSIWPLVKAGWPEAQLDIAGSVARGFAAERLERVRFLGIVDRLDQLYADASLIISPLTFGSGLKIKLVEALAAGKAAVVTSITLQGVDEICRRAVAVADHAEAFAAHILRLHREPESRAALAQEALEVAQLHFSPQACYGAFVAWLEDVAKKPI